jgi:Molybdopterin-binding domain of aldehyde dehydrogenase
VGEPVAVVAAVSPEIAEDALERIDLVIGELPGTVDWETATRPLALLFEHHDSHASAGDCLKDGDIDAAFRDAPYERRETFYSHRHTALAIETRGLIAHWNGKTREMRIWGSTKVLWFNRKVTAEALGASRELRSSRRACCGRSESGCCRADQLLCQPGHRGCSESYGGSWPTNRLDCSGARRSLLGYLIYDKDGQFLSRTLADYLVQLATNFPVVCGKSYGAKVAKNNLL